MTKVTILGEPKPKAELKPIEFVGCLMGSCKSVNFGKFISNPSHFDEITLITRTHAYDIMYCKNLEEPEEDIIAFGHFNDGFVVQSTY